MAAKCWNWLLPPSSSMTCIQTDPSGSSNNQTGQMRAGGSLASKLCWLRRTFNFKRKKTSRCDQDSTVSIPHVCDSSADTSCMRHASDSSHSRLHIRCQQMHSSWDTATPPTTRSSFGTDPLMRGDSDLNSSCITKQTTGVTSMCDLRRTPDAAARAAATITTTSSRSKDHTHHVPRGYSVEDLTFGPVPHAPLITSASSQALKEVAARMPAFMNEGAEALDTIASMLMELVGERSPACIAGGGQGRILAAICRTQHEEHVLAAVKLMPATHSSHRAANEVAITREASQVCDLAMCPLWAGGARVGAMPYQLLGMAAGVCSLQDVIDNLCEEGTRCVLSRDCLAYCTAVCLCIVNTLWMHDILHLDCKPANLIMLGPEAPLMIIDWGYGQKRAPSTSGGFIPRDCAGGTQGYMPHEADTQVGARRITPLSHARDVYGMGVTLWCLALAGATGTQLASTDLGSIRDGVYPFREVAAAAAAAAAAAGATGADDGDATVFLSEGAGLGGLVAGGADGGDCAPTAPAPLLPPASPRTALAAAELLSPAFVDLIASLTPRQPSERLAAMGAAHLHPFFRHYPQYAAHINAGSAGAAALAAMPMPHQEQLLGQSVIDMYAELAGRAWNLAVDLGL